MNRLSIAIGPELPRFGSWNWLGSGMLESLRPDFDVRAFASVDNPPEADVLIFLKFKPSVSRLQELRQRSRLIFMPVDVYGSAAEIDMDRSSLRCMELVIVHCLRLVRYFQGTMPVRYLHHPLKYALSAVREPVLHGPLLWIGVQQNLSAVRRWWLQTRPPEPLWILSDAETMCPETLGFPNDPDVRVAKWNPATHLDWTAQAFCALDIKADDFRSRHKPPAKSLDFAASGVPVITNRGSSVDLQFRHFGLRPLYPDTWRTQLSPAYQQQLRASVTRLRPHLTAASVWSQLATLLRRDSLP